MQETTHVDGGSMIRPDRETPFRDGIGALQVTADEARGIRAFIRELKPGVYVKCSRCNRMKYQSSINFVGTHEVSCDGCA